MKKFTLFFINLMLLCSMAFAGSGTKDILPSTKPAESLRKTTTVAYPVAYTYSSIPFAPLSTAGTDVFLSDDVVSGVLPVGFNFDFYGETYSNFYISSNGFITFNAGTFNGCCSGNALPNSTDGINNIIAAAWEDLYPPGGGSITYATVGTAPNRQLVVSYTNIPHYSAGNSVTTQIILYETTNVIEIHTAAMPSDGGVHTQGIENADGTIALATPGRNATSWSAINDAVRFDPSAASLNFDGFDDIVQVNQTLGNFGTGDFTIELQVKTFQSQTYLVSKRGTCDVDNFLSISIGGGKVGVETYNINIPGSNAGFSGNIVINDNIWHKVAVTRVLGTLKIYVDGVLDTTWTPTTPQNASIDLNNSYTLQFGGNAPCTPFGGNQPFNGNLDEIRFWSRGLPQCEIQNNLNCELASGQNNLLAYYKFNQGNPGNNNSTITSLTDESGNSNTATLSNFTLNGATSNWDLVGAVVSGFSCTPIAVFQYYVDADGDGFGNPALPSVSNCTLTAGYSLNNTDCNDAAATVFPGATEICYDGLDNNCDGTIDEGCTPIVTVVQSSQCGVTLATIDQDVFANLVTNVQGYRFRVTNLTTNLVQTIDRNLRVFRITQLPVYAFNTSYRVEVAVKKNNVWQPFFGSPCTVSTPATTTQVQSSQCGATISALTDVIYANLVPFATGYRFKVINLSNSTETVLVRSLREFRMNLLSSPMYGTTYSVEVAVRNTDGTYLPYGSICNITTPSFPTTQLQASQCGYTATSNSEIIYANAFTSATAYRFKISNVSLGYTYTIDRSLRTFSLNLIPGLQSATPYSVEVSLKVNGVFGPYGTACSVTTPGLARMVANVTKPQATTLDFKAIAYPNPFAADFRLNVTTSSEENVQIRVYDMLGKLVEDKQVAASDLENLQVGANYTSGVYNVVVNQGENTQTLRVIKR